MSIFKRLASAVLAVAMLAGMLPPLSVHAEEIETLPDTVETVYTEPRDTTAPEAETTVPTEGITLPAETLSAYDPAANAVAEDTQPETVPSPAAAPTEIAPVPTETDWEVSVIDDGIADSGSCGETLTWTLTEDGTLTISGTGTMEEYQYVNYIPWYDYKSQITGVILEEGVTSICSSAFTNCRALRSVTLPSSLETIGNRAFESCWELTTVALQEGLITIGDEAFYNCTSMNVTALPDSIQSIGERAFSGCYDMTASTLPASLTTLGSSAFEYCQNVTFSEIPQGVTVIGGYAFSNCQNITAMVIPEGVVTIGISAFASTGLQEATIPASVTNLCQDAFGYNYDLTAIHVAPGNAHYCSQDGILFNTDKTLLIQYPANKTGSAYTIPETVTAIQACAFQENAHLTSVEIPGSVVSIGAFAFYSCNSLTTVILNEGLEEIGENAFNSSALTSITIPASVIGIHDQAFGSCYDLTAIYVAPGNAYYSSLDGILMDKDKTELLVFPKHKTTCVIPDTVTSLDTNFFYSSDLTSVEIPGTVTAIPYAAFSYCSKLENVTLGEGIQTLGSYAFDNCTALTSIEIPASVTYIANQVFSGCTGLKEVHFKGDAPTYIDASAFGGYYSSEKVAAVVTYPADNATWTEDLFQNYGGTLTWIMEGMEVPVATGQCGRDLYWTLSESGVLTVTGTGAMKNYNMDQDVPWYAYCSDITEVIIGEGATNVGRKAFNRCKSLTKVTLPATVTAIGDYAFYYCESLPEIALPDAVTSIGANAFAQCRALETVTMGQNVEHIGDNAFGGTPWYDQQSGNQEFVILSGVLIKYNGNSTVVEIPESVLSIGARAFHDCPQLETVIIPEGVCSIGARAFDQCTALTSVALPSTLTVIGDYAFRSCPLASVTLPEGLRTIGNYAFANNARLQEIILPDSLTSLGCGAFLNCTGLNDVHIGAGVRALEDSTFEGCTGLTAIVIPYTITLIDSYVFNNCKNLADVTFQEGISLLGGAEDEWDDPWDEGGDDVTVYPDPGTALEISFQSFGNCDALTEVYLPGHLTRLHSNAFQGCDNTTHFYVSSPAYISDASGSVYMHSGGTVTTLVCVPAKLSGKFVIPDTVTSIQADFYGCSLLTSITFSAGAGGICDDTAFFGCTSLTEIIAGEGNTGGYYNDASGALLRNSYGNVYLCGLPADLTEYTVPADVTLIYTGSISNASLTAIHVAEGNQEYTSLDGVLFTDNGTTLVKYPGARADTRYVVPAEVEQLDDYSFLRPENLKELWFAGDPFYVNTDAFDSGASDLVGYYPQNLWEEEFADEMGYITGDALQWKPYTLLTVGDGSVSGIASGVPLAVRTTRDISGLKSVQADGKTLAASNYFISETGNFVCFLPAYLDTLADTGHTFRFQFADGYEEISTYDEASAAMAEFEAMLAEAEETGRPVTLTKAVTLTKNLVLGEYTLWIQEGGHLTVPSGITLTVNGSVHLNSGGKLDVEAGGTLLNRSVLDISGAGDGTYIHVDGTYSGQSGQVRVTAGPEGLPDITGIGKEFQRLYAYDADKTLLLWALAQQDLGYGQIIITMEENITLDEDVTIGRETRLSVYPNYDRKADTTLTLNGSTTLEGTLYIDSYTGYGISGIVQNNGSFTITSTGSLEVQGQFLGNEPVIQGITQAEFEQQLAQAAGTGRNVMLKTPLTLERDLTVNTTVTVEGLGHLTVPSGITLTVNRQLSLYENGKLDVAAGGTLVNNGYISINRSETGYLHVNGTYVHGEDGYVDVVNTSDVTGIAPGFQTMNFYNSDEAQFLQALQLQDRGYLEIYVSTNNLVLDSDVTIGQNTTLNITPSYNEDAQGLTINGNVTLEGTLIVGAYEESDVYGTLRNNGTLTVTSTGILQIRGRFLGNEPIYQGPSQAEFEAMLAEAAETGNTVTLKTPLTLERDLSIEDCNLIIRDSGRLTVPAGITLTNNGYLRIWEGGQLDVEPGGTLVNNGIVYIEAYGSSHIHVNGTYVHGEGGRVTAHGEETLPEVTGIDPAYMDISFYCYDESLLLFALAQQDRGYRNISVTVNGAVLYSDITIPQGLTLYVTPSYNGNQQPGLTVNSNVRVEGNLLVESDSNENVYGFLQNNGTLTVAETGRLIVNGTLNNDGTLTVLPNGQLSGTVQGNAPVYSGSGSGPDSAQAEFEALLAEAAETGSSVYLYEPLTLERDLTINCLVYVDRGGHLTVPSGITLTVNNQLGIQDGRVDVQAGGTLANNGSLSVSRGSLHVNGTYIHGEAGNLCLYCNDTAVPDVTGIDPGFQTLDFYDADEATLLYAASQADRGYGRITVSAYELVLNGDVTIPENMTLSVYANDGGTLPNLTNNGNLTLMGTLIVERFSGSNSQHRVQNNGTLSITSSGNVTGWIDGNAPIYLGPTQTELEQMLNTQGTAVVYLESTLVLERDLTIPEGVGLSIERPNSVGAGHLIVPDGCTLTVNGSLSVDGKLDVEAGGKLVNNGSLSAPEYSEDDRYIHINGSYVHGDGASVSMSADGNKDMPDVTGIESKYIDLTVDIPDDDETLLLDALTLETRYHSLRIYVRQLTLNSDVTIGENTKLLIPYTPDTAGANLTVNGSLTVNGYMEILGSDPPRVGSVQNNGSLTVSETGELLSVGYLRGNEPILNGGFFYSNLGGPVPNFREFELRTESSTVDTSTTGTVLLAVHTAPLLHAPEAPTFPDWTWTSSNHSIVDPSAIISNPDGTFTVPVKETAMGTVTLTASFKYMPGVTASVTFTVFHLDPARTLTASADLPAIGLQTGQQAKMLVFGSDPETALDAGRLVFSSANGEIASVDEQGVVTAGSRTGTVKITAAIAGDPLNRKVTLSVKVISPQTQSLVLTDASGTVVTGTELDLAALNGQSHTFRLIPQAGYAEGITPPTLNAKSFKWTSSDTKLATVKVNADGSADITIKAGAHGACTVTAQSTDLAKVTATFSLTVSDRSPRLGASAVTLNPMAASGAEVVLVSSYGNEILADGITVADDRIQAQYDPEQGILTLRTTETANSTIKTVLTVPCQDGNRYTYALKVTVKVQAPAVTVKQAGKLDLFYADTAATLTVTAKNAAVTYVELTDTEDFTLTYDGETASVVLSDSYLAAPSAKPDNRATLLVWLEGYAQPVSKAVTLGTTTTKLSLTADPASSVLNTALSQDRSIRFRVLNKKTKEALFLTQDQIVSVTGSFVESFDVTPDGQIRLDLAGTAGGTAVITVQADNWTKAVQLSHKVTVSEALPTVKLAQGTLKLSSVFTGQTAASAVTVSHGNLDITGFGTDNSFTSTAKAGTTAYAEAAKLRVYYDGEQVVAQIRDPENVPKNGNYTFSAIPMLEGTELKAVTVKVNVSSKEPKVKAASTVKLNTQLSGSETATVAVTLTNSTGYPLTLVDFVGMDAYPEAVELLYDDASGQFQTTLLSGASGKYVYSLIPVVQDDQGREVRLSAPVKLTVQAKSGKVSVSQSASGKLDLMNPDSSIVYTVKKITNAAGSIQDITLVDASGEETDLFLAAFDEEAQTFTLTLDPLGSYSTRETYKVKLRYTLCGITVDSPVLNLKVTQSKLKVTAEKAQYFQSQAIPLSVKLTAASPAGAKLAAVSVNTAKTADALLKALDSENLTFSFPEGTAEARLQLPVKNPGQLTAGKSYTLYLDVMPLGVAEPTEVKVTVTVNR